MSNVLDFSIYLLVFLLLFKMSRLDTESGSLYYFYFVSFLFTFFFPVVLIKNTIGKKVLGLQWTEVTNLKLKLGAKYTLYYLAVAPSFSIITAITSFPFLNPEFRDFDKILSAKIFLVYITTDILVFVFSLGKHHLLDYVLNLSLKKSSYSRKPYKTLTIVYVFFGLLFFANVYTYKYDITFSRIESHFGKGLYKEHYPSDLYYGSGVFTLKDQSPNVFSPSKPLSFIYSQKLPQKTLYLNLPEIAFNSESERKKICMDIVAQSRLNDLFSEFKPRQTRIVLSNFKRGFFLEYYNNFYIYYYDNYLPEWNIYGGIQADSITMRSYIAFNNNHVKSLLKKIENMEEKLGLTWKEIVDESENNEVYSKEIMELYRSNLDITTFYDGLEIKLDTSKLELNRIEFSDTKLNGYMNINLPVQDLEQRVNLTNFLNDELLEYDENVDYLRILRDEITNKGI